MTTIESSVADINRPAETIYNFLSDFNNFKSLMPPQVTNWKSDTDSCSFSITGMADIGMRIVEKTPHSHIKIGSDGKNPFGFTLESMITSVDAGNCKSQLVMKADINPFMGAMVNGPLKKFLDMLVEKMKEIPA